MKILMVSDFYPPHLGGAERAVADLGAELAARGHEVAVVTLWHDGLARRERDGAVTIHRLRGGLQRLPFAFKQPDRRYHPPVPDPALTRGLGRLVAAQRPDVVHGHSWMMLSALPLRGTHRVATVATLHDYAALCPRKTLLYRDAQPCPWGLSTRCLRCAAGQYGAAKGALTAAGLGVGRRAYRGVDTFVAISSYVAAVHAREELFAGARIVTIPNFVRDEVARTPAGPPLPGLPHGYILFVGALSRHKGLHVLLDAYAHLQAPIPLVLIGRPGRDTPPVFPPGVVALPGLSHRDVIRAMDHCRFLVSPALWPEPFGLAAIEAMARGKAVIAAGAGGALDIVQPGVTGLLAAPGDAGDLARAMRLLAFDPALAARLGRAGAARRAALFSPTVVAPRIEAVYRDALARAQRKAGGAS